MGLLSRFRSARTGRYISGQDAQANPDTSVSERPDRVHAAARALVAAWEGDDTGLTDPLTPYFEQLREALKAKGL